MAIIGSISMKLPFGFFSGMPVGMLLKAAALSFDLV